MVCAEADGRGGRVNGNSISRHRISDGHRGGADHERCVYHHARKKGRIKHVGLFWGENGDNVVLRKKGRNPKKPRSPRPRSDPGLLRRNGLHSYTALNLEEAGDMLAFFVGETWRRTSAGHSIIARHGNHAGHPTGDRRAVCVKTACHADNLLRAPKSITSLS